MYIIFKDAYYTPPLSNIVRIVLRTKQLDEDSVLKGAIGMDICFEPIFKIIVADKNHQSILLIENMKYLKRVL